MSPADAPRAAQPTAAADRILLLDALRGFALLGILLMNLPLFHSSVFAIIADPWPVDTPNRVSNWLSDVLLNGKFNSLFSFLFGIGFVLQVRRLQERTGHWRRLYLRRLAVLATLGLAHLLLVWYGDVLHVYAGLGLALLFLHRLSARGFVWLAVGLFCARLALAAVPLFVPDDSLPPGFLAEQIAADQRAYTSRDVGAMVQRNVFTAIGGYFSGFMLGFWLELATTLCLGVAFARWGWLADPRTHRSKFTRLLTVCGPLGLLAGALGASAPYLIPGDRGDAFHALLIATSRPLLLLAYVSGFALLFAAGTWQGGLARLGVVGRMPLTNYLLESVIGILLFRGIGFNLYGQVNHWQGSLIAIAIYAGLVVFSQVWLARFPLGPMEWLWRRATYGGTPPEPPTARTSAAAG